MGRNGAGKTTLMRLLAGDEQPDHGRDRTVARHARRLVAAGRAAGDRRHVSDAS